MVSTTTMPRRSIAFLIATLLALHDCSNSGGGLLVEASPLAAGSLSQVHVVTSTTSTQTSDVLAEAEVPKCNTDTDGDGAADSYPSSSSWSTSILEQSTKNQNAYIQASPLSVAAVCSDGIALLSFHSNVDVESNNGDESSSSSNKSDSDVNDDALAETTTDNDNNILSKTHQLQLFQDLPLSTRGPLRIEPLYEHHQISSSSSLQQQSIPPPMAILTAGWRTDSLTLADAGRELCMEEVRLYCLPSLVTTTTSSNNNEGSRSRADANGQEKKLLKDTNAETTVVQEDDAIMPKQHQQQSYYGQRIAEGLSYYLAKCTFSEGIRSLSCVGLLACGSDYGDEGGSLYLVDATGTHNVRAHAIGHGSSVLHKRMVFIDFSKMDCEEGLRVLLRLIAEEGGLLPVDQSSKQKMDANGKILQGNDSQNASKTIIAKKPEFVVSKSNTNLQTKQDGETPATPESRTPSSSWSLPPNTAVELAMLKSGEGRMRRVRLPSLFALSDNQQCD